MNKIVYQEFTSSNILGVTVEHNGFQGGDEGHGGFVRIAFENKASTSMQLNGEYCDSFDFTFRGDTERETLLSGLRMIVKELEDNPHVLPSLV